MSNLNIAKLTAIIGFKPINCELYREALTHSSYRNETGNILDYERLEFLGDAVLELVTSDYLFTKLPDAREGVLTEKRKSIVRANTLGKVALVLGIDELIFLSKGEKANRGASKISILADVFEALIAAIYQDKGLDAVRAFLERTLFEYANQNDLGNFDHKTKFQEYIQAKQKGKIVYSTRQAGKNDLSFESSLFVAKQLVGKGYGRSKREAEQAAAKKGLTIVVSPEKEK